MMSKITYIHRLLTLVMVFVTAWGWAQMVQPVQWQTQVKPLENNTYALVLKGTIESGWHLYSQHTPDGGPLPAELQWTPQTAAVQWVGKTQESAYKKQHNADFDVDEYFFEKQVIFTQKVIINAKTVSTVHLKIDYQVCKDVCLNQKKEFDFKLDAMPSTPAVASTSTDTVQTAAADSTPDVTTPTTKANNQLTAASQPNESNEPSETPDERRSLWTLFWLSFLGGFTALLTPCVFPMIPMTVSFFTKRHEKRTQGIRQALLYGLSIILIYVLLGSVVTALFGADALNALSTDPWFNLIFFVILVFFAASFLGAFELVLPYSWANRMDQQAEKGGVLGILFMALALAIVSFSCTGPIVGTLLVQAASMGGLSPLIGMLGFSSALALPFMLFALFPGWLASLPKSGGWLNTVKVSLGFLELALAFKFLSTADLVLQLHLLEREVFLALWIAIFGAWAFYLFGAFRTSHDSPSGPLSVGRLLMAMTVMAFTLYLVPGLWGAPLKLISGFPPPDHYSENASWNPGGGAAEMALPTGAERGPLGLTVFHDYTQGMAYAKQVGKPALIDFTGHGCQNCRRMENNVWALPEVKAILSEQVVLISLYVDDKRLLPADKQYVSKETGNRIETIGDQWTELIITRYQANTQPYYVMLDAHEHILEKPISVADGPTFLTWLQKGITAYSANTPK